MFKSILLAILLISSTSSTSTTSAYTTNSTSNTPPLPPGPFNLNDPKLTHYTAVEKRKRTPGQVKSDMSRLAVSIKDFNVSIAEFPQGSASHALIQALVRSVQLVLFVPIIGIHHHDRLR
ncbi:hypothetical protein ONZ45_g16894 [Pleurotus djamor]|nr:hypothetical protein ONZ45_g16894 [Pleurotus djamor]